MCARTGRRPCPTGLVGSPAGRRVCRGHPCAGRGGCCGSTRGLGGAGVSLGEEEGGNLRAGGRTGEHSIRGKSGQRIPWPDEALPRSPKGCGFDSLSGHRPRLQGWSLVGARMGGNRSTFLSVSLKSIHAPPAESQIPGGDTARLYLLANSLGSPDSLHPWSHPLNPLLHPAGPSLPRCPAGGRVWHAFPSAPRGCGSLGHDLAAGQRRLVD